MFQNKQRNNKKKIPTSDFIALATASKESDKFKGFYHSNRDTTVKLFQIVFQHWSIFFHNYKIKKSLHSHSVRLTLIVNEDDNERLINLLKTNKKRQCIQNAHLHMCSKLPLMAIMYRGIE